MDAAVDLLEEVQLRRVRAEQRRQYGEEAQRAVGRTVGGHLSAVFLPNHEMDPAGWIGRKPEVHNVHRRQFPNPLSQNRLASLVRANFPQDRRQVLATLTQKELGRKGRLPREIWNGIEKVHTSKFFSN